jgi:hypothetical protein
MSKLNLEDVLFMCFGIALTSLAETSETLRVRPFFDDAVDFGGVEEGSIEILFGSDRPSAFGGTGGGTSNMGRCALILLAAWYCLSLLFDVKSESSGLWAPFAYGS